MEVNGYHDNVTYQEIVRQQSIWKEIVVHLDLEKEKNKTLLNRYRDRVWIFSGCGTSYYLAQTASIIFEKLTGICTKAVPASEILINPETVFNKKENYILVALSRSGSTTEIVRAVQKARDELNIPTLAISCDMNSKMSRESQHILAFPFEQERSVVMTGSFTSMLLAIIHLGSLFLDVTNLTERLTDVAETSQKIMEESEVTLKTMLHDYSISDYVFLGQGINYGIANEAALKLQEMSISFSQSFHSLEYRHGPLSTATENTLITIISSQSSHKYDLDLVTDMKKLGAKVMLLRVENDSQKKSLADFDISVPRIYGDILNPLLYMPVLHLLGYHAALSKNINPDKPRNLTAVVQLQI